MEMMDMSDNSPVEPENLADEVEKLHTAGMSQSEIARQMDTTRYYVQKVSKERGLTWDTTRTFEATEVNSRLADNEIAELAEMFRKVAKINLMEVLDGLNVPADRKSLTTVAAISFDKSLAAAQYLSDKYQDNGMSEASGKLAELMESVREASIVQGADLNASD